MSAMMLQGSEEEYQAWVENVPDNDVWLRTYGLWPYKPFAYIFTWTACKNHLKQRLLIFALKITNE